MTTLGLCVGHHDLFDSVDAHDHTEAAELCAACPLLDACRRQVGTIERPHGTWAGELYGSRGQQRHHPPCGTEQGYQWHRYREGRVTCEDCKAAHREAVKRGRLERLGRAFVTCPAATIWPEIGPHGARLTCCLPAGHGGDHACADVEYIGEEG